MSRNRLHYLAQQYCTQDFTALFDLKTSILIQNRRPHTRNLNSEMPGDNKNMLLHHEHSLEC